MIHRFIVFLSGVLACLLGVLPFPCSMEWLELGHCMDPTSVPVRSYEVVRTFPHDPGAFTQGLVFEKGFLYEGTGLRGQSTLRKVALESGRVVKLRRLPSQYFGEGITIRNNEIIQLTWRSRVGFVYAKDTFSFLRDFNYATEGWGITHDGHHLIMSDGTPTLRILDPQTFEEVQRMTVRDKERAVSGLNELEYVQGEIYANVWQTERIARIAPETGLVIGWIDLTDLLNPLERLRHVDVLNGIAYDSEKGRLFVTGKRWPKVFEIRVVPAKE